MWRWWSATPVAGVVVERRNRRRRGAAVGSYGGSDCVSSMSMGEGRRREKKEGRKEGDVCAQVMKGGRERKKHVL